jgi:hypothetical protein
MKCPRRLDLAEKGFNQKPDVRDGFDGSCAKAPAARFPDPPSLKNLHGYNCDHFQMALPGSIFGGT